MKFPIPPFAASRSLWLALLLALVPAFAGAATTPAADDANAIRPAAPMTVEVEAEGGAHGQLVVGQEIIDADAGSALIYTITTEPLHGRVGLAGEDSGGDFFATKTSRTGYYAYRPEDGYAGTDSFAYTVRNEATGLVFKNTVEITVAPGAPVVLDKIEVTAKREHAAAGHEVTLTTRPNTPVTQKIPSHEDFMPVADRVGFDLSKVVYLLEDSAKPQHGTAKLARDTGELTYAPDPGFIGKDSFKYYTADENNPQLGVENTITVTVEPNRHLKQVTADRSRNREVDLVFVINNSKSMAAHQARIAANLNRFRQLFRARDLDYRIGVLTTDFVDRPSGSSAGGQTYYKKVPSIELDAAGQPVLNRQGKAKTTTKRVASNGALVTLPGMPQPWVTPATPDGIFAELVKVGTNGSSNRTAFTAVYNFVANYYHKQHAFLRPEATTIVVFFMDEEETRMATWKKGADGTRLAKWVEDGKLPALIGEYNAAHPRARQTLDGYINSWVINPFVIAKGNKRGKLEINAVVSPANVSHRRAAELTGGTVLNIESDFSAPLAALGDRIADTVAVALDPVTPGASFYQKSLRVLVDGQPVAADADNGYVYDERTHSIRFQGAAKKKAFAAKIEISYEEHQ